MGTKSLKVCEILRTLLQEQPDADVNEAVLAVWEAQGIRFSQKQVVAIKTATKASGISAQFNNFKNEKRN